MRKSKNKTRIPLSRRIQDIISADKPFRKMVELVFELLVKGSFKIKISLGLLLIIAIFLLARAGSLGERGKRIAHDIIPFYIYGIDDQRPFVSLHFGFKVNGEDGFIGNTYYTGDQIELYFDNIVTSQDVLWYHVFGIDRTGIYMPVKNIFPKKISPKEGMRTIYITLNNTTGPEIFYVVASHQEINFEKDIKPAANQVFLEMKQKILQGKGGMATLGSILPLEGEDYFYEYLYFDHVDKKL